ncbi:MAG TPA: LLM class flavin-dependent oxidoreductase [Candidatus Binataceae bacterium]|jgi:alkanesulfonate monooxygenase SsuD/methylene tetrahydromethanopterin reductase-like flavin-dependent oxidoreductase (luciferase family)|nr:LLM class flavin-dependent oxidoreductase [Candidatus Binataceae bacterium]
MKGYGVTVAPMSVRVADFVQLARETEDAGFSGVYIPEAVNDALMGSLLVAQATRRITIATWIVNIYLREPGLCAVATATVQDAAEGRFVLGLGVSHRPALEARGIAMGNARERLRRDTEIIRKALRGELDMFGMKFPSPRHPVPIYYAALALETARLGGELADGLMLYMCSPERMRKSMDAAEAVARERQRPPGSLTMTCGIPVFLHDDLATAYEAARRGLAFYGALPFYNRILAKSGFAEPAAQIAQAAARRDPKAMAAAITNDLADAVALVGPASRCLERLEQYRLQNPDILIFAPNAINEDYASAVRRIHRAFARLN